MAGSRSIVDEVFLDFLLEAMTQVIQQAANVHYSSNGKIKVPVVIRALWARCATPDRITRMHSIHGSRKLQD